jgi:hypothetical protein
MPAGASSSSASGQLAVPEVPAVKDEARSDLMIEQDHDIDSAAELKEELPSPLKVDSYGLEDLGFIEGSDEEENP